MQGNELWQHMFGDDPGKLVIAEVRHVHGDMQRRHKATAGPGIFAGEIVRLHGSHATGLVLIVCHSNPVGPPHFAAGGLDNMTMIRQHYARCNRRVCDCR